MHVCLVSRAVLAHGPGGMQEHTIRLAEGLARKGHEVTVLTTPHPEGVAEEVTAGVRTLYLGAGEPGCYSPTFFAKAREHVARLERETHLDVIHSQSVGAQSIRNPHVPVLAFIHGTYLSESPLWSTYLASLDTLEMLRTIRRSWRFVLMELSMASFCRRADGVAVVSQFSKRLVERMLVGSRTPVTVISHGIDTSRFRPLDQVESRAKLGLSPGTPTMLTVGRLVRTKGFHVGIEAIRRLGDCAATLVVAGEGEEGEALKTQAVRTGVASKVQFLGRVPEALLPSLYSAADIFVYTELVAPAFGLVSAEAMACGVPVIASANGAQPEIVTPEVGLLVRGGDPDALAAAIKKLLGSASTRARMGEQGRRRVKEKFEYGRMVDETAGLYEELIERAGRSP